jgi:Putative zinc-finger
MNSRFGCEEVRKLAPELALGITTGDERARTLAHLARCPDCRQYVSDLSGVADEVLLLAPAQEPPGGFEGRVLQRITEVDSRKPLRTSKLFVAVAAAVVAAAVAIGGVLFATREDRELAASLRADLEEADGDYFGVKALRNPDGFKDGVVFAYEGSPSWIFLDMNEDMESGTYSAEVEMEDGTTHTLGSPFELGADKAWWASALPVTLHDVTFLRIRNDHGAQVLTARF